MTDKTTTPQVPDDKPRFSLGGSQTFLSSWGERQNPTVRRFIMFGFGALFLLSVVRVVTDSPELTSSGTFGSALRLAVPIMLAGLGGIYAERTGVVNIGLEGMMILGTWFGAWGGFQYGIWWGALIGLIGGAMGGLLHAVATVTFNVDHIVSGVAINLLGLGGMRYLSVISYPPGSGGGATQSPTISGSIPKVDVPFLTGGELFGWQTPDLFGWVESQGWFLVSDIGGLLKGFFGDLSVLIILCVALVPLTWFFLWKTPLGLSIRSVGEKPVASESLGVNVYKMKYIGVVISGALAGLGGAVLVIEFANIYREGQAGGRGFIGLAAMIVGNWRPVGTFAAALLFGFADALQLRSEAAIHALLLFVAIALFLVAARAMSRQFGMLKGYAPAPAPVVPEGAPWTTRYRFLIQAVIVGAIGATVLAWFLISETVPSEFVFFTPHITTLVVMSIASQRLRMPAADGQPYRKGEAM
ncbi:ABC transporter permease [bacterium]|nr:ABC transporter permease [bacterium]